MRTILINLLFLTSLLVTGCSVYKVDVQQGNVLDEEDLAKVKVGMKKKQVIFLIGNPLLTDPFHKNRWDYVYSFKPGGGKTSSKILTLFFEGDTLVNLDDSNYKLQEVGKQK